MKASWSVLVSTLSAFASAGTVLDIGVLNVFVAVPGDFSTASTPIVERSASGACNSGTMYAYSKSGQTSLIWEDTAVNFCDKGPNWPSKTIQLTDGGHIRFNGCSHSNYLNIIYTTSDGRTYYDQCKATSFQCKKNGNFADHYNYRCGNLPI